MSTCPYCPHDMRDHCKPGTTHVAYKDAMKNAGMHMVQRTHKCVSAHCNVALCCCTGGVFEKRMEDLRNGTQH
jgi:hypothetical protein